MTKARKVRIIIYILFLSLLITSILQTYFIKVNVYEEYSQKIPVSFDNTKIVFLSDIHCGKFYSASRVKGLVQEVNEMKPDIVILGGDFASETEYFMPCINELKNLHALNGVYAVLGNHDNWEREGLDKELQKVGITMINNDATWIYKNNERIKLGGVGDLWTDKQNINPTIKDITQNDFVILVSHNPDYVKEIRVSNIDIMLSGHTHGGQISLFGLTSWPVSRILGTDYIAGIYETKETKLLVSTGIGTYGVPLRLFVSSEINVVILKRKNN